MIYVIFVGSEAPCAFIHPLSFEVAKYGTLGRASGGGLSALSFHVSWMRAHTHYLDTHTHTHTYTDHRTNQPLEPPCCLCFRGRFSLLLWNSSSPFSPSCWAAVLSVPISSLGEPLPVLGLLVSRAGLWSGLYSDWMHSRLTPQLLPPYRRTFPLLPTLGCEA